MERNAEGNSLPGGEPPSQSGIQPDYRKKFFLEPTIGVVSFNGDIGGQFSGEDHVYDFGLNWFLNKKSIKLSIHYVNQNGLGDNGYTWVGVHTDSLNSPDITIAGNSQ